MDPVCGMTPKVDTPHRLVHEGVEVLFCSGGCKLKFENDPQKYAAPPARPEAPPGTDWTCPMHPEIIQDHFGTCRLCGMALEPLTPDAGNGPNPELIDMTRRLWIASTLTIPVFTLEMGSHAFGWRPLPPVMGIWLEAVLATPVVLWAGAPFFVRGWSSLRTRNFNMFTLIALGTGASWVYSVVATVIPEKFPAEFHVTHGTVAVYFEAAAVITTLVLLGQVLELRARQLTSSAIKALLDIAPKTARRIRNDMDEDIAVDEIALGDFLRIRPGEKVPIDGVVTDGHSTLDESIITGESMPVSRQAGQRVIGGTLNQNGALVMKATAIGHDTVLAQIVNQVADAQRSRAPIQQQADKVAKWFVPVVFAVAIITFTSWFVLGPVPSFTYSLIATVSVLIIACPCALGLATPMSIMVAMGRGAQAGILIRNAAALERFEKVDTLIVDKTCTLTTGKPAVASMSMSAGFSEDQGLRLVAGLESRSEHPLAQAMVHTARDRGLSRVEATDFISFPGKGIEGTVDGQKLRVGRNHFLADSGIDTGLFDAKAAQFRQDGCTVIYIAIDHQFAGVIAIADPIKQTTPDALASLRRQGISIVMVTGDHRATAEAVARRLGITRIEAEILPKDKAAIIARLQARGAVVAMAGDGVNDAPAIASADVGIAMSTGADIAIESAGITLLGGDLNGVVRAITLSRSTMRNIRQNLAFAFAYNAAGIPVAAGALYPFTGELLSPMIAAAAMAASSLSVIANALRLRYIRL